MPKELESSEYWSAAELIRELGVSRQTLWRWRRLRKIPVGRRFRDGQILFTPAEADSIRHYANKVEPVTAVSVNQ
jgi:transposase-like protein